MPRPDVSRIHDCEQLSAACDQVGEVPASERQAVKDQLIHKSLELNCPESIPDDWKVRIGDDYE